LGSASAYGRDTMRFLLAAIDAVTSHSRCRCADTLEEWPRPLPRIDHGPAVPQFGQTLALKNQLIPSGWRLLATACQKTLYRQELHLTARQSDEKLGMLNNTPAIGAYPKAKSSGNIALPQKGTVASRPAIDMHPSSSQVSDLLIGKFSRVASTCAFQFH
jgi:hypothetical protein